MLLTLIPIDLFRDVMVADGTVLRLHEFLSDQFEARHEEQAGAKLHLLHNATEQTIERIDTADEKTHDSTLFKTGPWLENRLMLFDPPTSKAPPVCADRRERRLLREPAETEREPGDYGRITEWRAPRHSL